MTKTGTSNTASRMAGSMTKIGNSKETFKTEKFMTRIGNWRGGSKRANLMTESMIPPTNWMDIGKGTGFMIELGGQKVISKELLQEEGGNDRSFLTGITTIYPYKNTRWYRSAIAATCPFPKTCVCTLGIVYLHRAP
jgi:hypothetical protein